MKKMTLVLAATAALLSGCSDKDTLADADGAGGGGGAADGAHFTVTIENVAKTKLFTSSGVFNTPVDGTEPGAATPGKMYKFTIDAGRKQRLSFATMLAATNDLFFAPQGEGIALYDEDGEPISGDVTDQIYLWDAGTEVNEEPAVGPNTVTHQDDPNTGPAENGNVRLIEDVTSDDFDYPSVEEVMTVTITHVSGTMFEVTIENISAVDALMTTDGPFPAPFSPGVWVVHNGVDPLFTEGEPDFGKGIENIAEDGDPTNLGDFAHEMSGLTYPASPGVWVLHESKKLPLFTVGEADYGLGIEGIAEDGNPTNLGGNLEDLAGYMAGAVFNMPVGMTDPGPIRPGSMYEFEFDAKAGEALSFATMLAATNDVFFGTGEKGIDLFDADGKPLSGDITELVYLWDAGTETNEEPGIGPNTVTNQLMPDTGEDEDESVQLLSDVDDGFTYPQVSSVLKITIAAQ